MYFAAIASKREHLLCWSSKLPIKICLSKGFLVNLQIFTSYSVNNNSLHYRSAINSLPGTCHCGGAWLRTGNLESLPNLKVFLAMIAGSEVYK